jgi:hypothetical protein
MLGKPMPYIDKIPLKGIKIIPELQNAPVGVLLQIAIPNDSSIADVGLRCTLDMSNAQSLGVVFLEGTHTGQFFTDAELNYAPAIDISAIAHIVLTEPAPQRNKNVVGGDMYHVSVRGNTFLCVAVCLHSKPTELFGYALLEGEPCGKITMISDKLYIGKVAVVPLVKPTTQLDDGCASRAIVQLDTL